jgi:hypothetical protein
MFRITTEYCGVSVAAIYLLNSRVPELKSEPYN